MQNQKLNTKTILINGLVTSYWQNNQKTTRKVVLALHGFMSDLRSIQPFVSDLVVEDNTRVLLPDLPGFGSSEPLNDNPTLDEYVAWAEAFVNAVCPKAQKIIIVGYSFGAYIAVKFAADPTFSRITRLILITPVVKISPQVRLFSNGYDLLAALSMRAALKLYVWPPSFDFTTYYLLKTKNKTVRQKLRLYRRQELEALRPELVLNLYRRLLEIDLQSYASRIRAPVLIVMAEKDNVAFNHFTHNFMKDIRTDVIEITIDNAGHLLPFEEPERLASAVNANSNNPAEHE
jgi:pimeloyl-ACP methyl ester carboxylesterase